jgi:hypothetical protein
MLADPAYLVVLMLRLDGAEGLLSKYYTPSKQIVVCCYLVKCSPVEPV